MNCDEIRDRLDRYHRGVLPLTEAADIGDHLAGCPDCRRDLEALESLGGFLAGLPREVSPAADLWPGIASRLSPTRRIRMVPLWLALAASLVLVASSSAVTWWLARGPRVAVSPPSLNESGYLDAIADLAPGYLRNQARLAPETRRLLERNLAVIERALEEARAALVQEPGNAALADIVVAAYRRKIEFLERATTLDRES